MLARSYHNLLSNLLVGLLILLGLGLNAVETPLWARGGGKLSTSGPTRDGVMRLPSLSSLLTSSARSSQWVIEQPSYGLLTLQHGATIYIIDETPIASLQPQGIGHKTTPGGDSNKLLSYPSIKLLGRKLYLSEQAESLQILDITGQVVLSYRQAREANLSLPPGVYMLRCLFGGQSLVCRIILR